MIFKGKVMSKCYKFVTLIKFGIHAILTMVIWFMQNEKKKEKEKCRWSLISDFSPPRMLFFKYENFKYV